MLSLSLLIVSKNKVKVIQCVCTGCHLKIFTLYRMSPNKGVFNEEVCRFATNWFPTPIQHDKIIACPAPECQQCDQFCFCKMYSVQRQNSEWCNPVNRIVTDSTPFVIGDMKIEWVDYFNSLDICSTDNSDYIGTLHLLYKPTQQ
jgi:hypothetical protein